MKAKLKEEIRAEIIRVQKDIGPVQPECFLTQTAGKIFVAGVNQAGKPSIDSHPHVAIGFGPSKPGIIVTIHRFGDN